MADHPLCSLAPLSCAQGQRNVSHNDHDVTTKEVGRLLLNQMSQCFLLPFAFLPFSPSSLLSFQRITENCYGIVFER